MAEYKENKIKEIYAYEGTDSSIKWRLTDICNYQCSYCLRRGPAQARDTHFNEHHTLQGDSEIALATAPEINRIVEELPGTVKLNLIGGEISLFDNLIDILKLIPSEKLVHVNLTSNLSANVEWYTSLHDYCKSRNLKLGLTVSYHPESITLESFIEKAVQLNEQLEIFKCECVSRLDAQDIVLAFEQACVENNLKYIIDADMRFGGENKETLIKEGVTKTPRLKVTYTDGTEEFYNTRNSFITQDKEFTTPERNGVKLQGYYCSRDVRYVYIEFDKHVGKISVDGSCRMRIPIQDFHVLNYWGVCNRFGCSLCGGINISDTRKTKDE